MRLKRECSMMGICKHFVRMVIPVAFVLATRVFAQEIDLSGEWTGAIDLPTGKLEIIVNFQQEDGTWKGRIDIPAQMARNLPLTGISIQGRTIQFAIENIPGNPGFSGRIAEDGSTISGQFTQSGQTFAFELRKAAEAEARTLEQTLNLIAAFVDSMRRVWEVPGVAMAIVKNDRILLAKGFGYRDVAKQQPVTENTLFAIGSCTKAFTTMAIAMLVEEGVVDWDKPVRTYLPDFTLKDPFASERMTPRDLVTHRSGLPRHDMLWYGATFTRRQLFERLQYLEPSKDFRAAFQYQNLMYMTAGYLVGRVTGSTWESFVRKRILDPLDMRSSNFSVTEMQKAGDFALPYRKKDERVEHIPFRNIDAMGPAGSINAPVKEMANWIMLHLNRGVFRGRRLVSENAIREMHTPQMVTDTPQRYPEVSAATYGLGWFIQTYRGHKRVYHGGAIDGFTALVSLLPHDGLGMVVLANLSGTPLPNIATLYATDLLLELEPIDWNTRIKSRTEQRKKADKKKDAEAELTRKRGTRPSHPLAEYAGTYEHPGYGVIEVEQREKALYATFHGFTARLEHWHYDVFRFMHERFNNPKIVFYGNDKGDIDRLSVPLEPRVDPIVFHRRPAAELSDPKYLSQFEGEYHLEGQIARIELQRHRLTLSLPGQPVYTLVPYKRGEFTIKGLSGYSVKFETSKEGDIVAVNFIQPNGIFRAVKK